MLPEDRGSARGINIRIGESIVVMPLDMQVPHGLDRQRRTLDAAARDRRLVLRQAVDGGREAQVASEHVASELRGMSDHVVDRGTGTAARISGLSAAADRHDAEFDPRKHGTYCNPHLGRCEYQTLLRRLLRPPRTPRFVGAAMVDEPQSPDGDPSLLEGGIVAAPASSDIAEGICWDCRSSCMPRETSADTTLASVARRAVHGRWCCVACGRR